MIRGKVPHLLLAYIAKRVDDDAVLLCGHIDRLRAVARRNHDPILERDHKRHMRVLVVCVIEIRVVGVVANRGNQQRKQLELRAEHVDVCGVRLVRDIVWHVNHVVQDVARSVRVLLAHHEKEAEKSLVRHAEIHREPEVVKQMVQEADIVHRIPLGRDKRQSEWIAR